MKVFRFGKSPGDLEISNDYFGSTFNIRRGTPINPSVLVGPSSYEVYSGDSFKHILDIKFSFSLQLSSWVG